MKISAYTVGDITVASSRLRSFYMFYASEKFGVKVFRNLKLWQSINCNYLHLQSCYKPKYLFQAIFFRLLLKKIVFDVSDIPKNKIHFIFFWGVAKVANSVTVPLETTRLFLGQYLNVNKIHVIPDVIDVCPEKLKQLNCLHRRPSKTFFWTGHPGNLDSIEGFIQDKRLREQYQLIVITKLNDIQKFIDNYPWVTFLEWDVDSVLNCEVEMCYALLNHSFDEASQFKCENKMVLSIAIGLIPIVSRTPAYEALAKKLNADCLIFDNLSDVFDIVESLDLVWINNFKLRAKSFVLEYYSNENIFSIFTSKCLIN
ncbi:GT4_WbuB-like domain containing protein [Methylophilaceae bacterium]